jgi:hypothetical protein
VRREASRASGRRRERASSEQFRSGATTWNTSIFPDAASGSYVLPVKRQVRDREVLDAGDTVHLTLEVVHHTDAV